VSTENVPEDRKSLARRAAWDAARRPRTAGVLAKYAAKVSPSSLGAVTSNISSSV